MDKEIALARRIKLVVNGKPVELEVGDELYASYTLARALRETLGLTGTKIGCDHGECGACTVLMEGEPVNSCMILAAECDGKHITTIEGLSDAENGQLHPLQQAFLDHFGFQCGFCTPGIILSAKAFLDRNPNPTEQEIKEALSGNLCRCGNYPDILISVQSAAKAMRGESK